MDKDEKSNSKVNEDKEVQTFGLIHSLFFFSALNRTRIKALIEILKEKGVFTDEEYKKSYDAKLKDFLPTIFKEMEKDAGLDGVNISFLPDGGISIEGPGLVMKSRGLTIEEEGK